MVISSELVLMFAWQRQQLVYNFLLIFVNSFFNKRIHGCGKNFAPKILTQPYIMSIVVSLVFYLCARRQAVSRT